MNILPEEICQKIDHWTAKYPSERRQSALLPALTLVQDYNGGWLSEELMNAVADYLKLSRVSVYEVASFYSMFELKPVGRHKICLCTNISCLLMGSEPLVEHLKMRLGIEFGETTADMRFTLKEVECLGACVNGPCAMVGREYHENLTPEKLDQLLDKLP